MRTPWHAFILLLRPSRVRENLEALRQAALVERVPNLWQIELGVLRMWHRILFRPETIGMSADHPVRAGWRARLFEYRPIRFPFLLREGSVAPWDLSGLLSAPERIMRHMLGTHHDGNQFIYDLQMLAVHPGRTEELLERARAVVEGTNPRRAAWLRDLVVYEHYHETLVEVVARALREGVKLPPDEDADPDISFLAYLRWCASQPTTPGETWCAWRQGTFHFGPARVSA
jgi:hypothetical protein